MPPLIHSRPSLASFVLIAFAGCDDVAEPFDLDHARVMAIRIDPPSLAPEQSARIDVLVTDATAEPRIARAEDVHIMLPPAAAAFERLLVRDATGWTVTAPDAATLMQLRTAAGLALDALVIVPLELTIDMPAGPLAATKTVALGQHADNPATPVILINGAAGLDSMPLGGEVVLAVADPREELDYRWFSSVGDLVGFTRAEASLEPIDVPHGIVAVVARDQAGGTAWTIAPVAITR